MAKFDKFKPPYGHTSLMCFRFTPIKCLFFRCCEFSLSTLVFLSSFLFQITFCVASNSITPSTILSALPAIPPTQPFHRISPSPKVDPKVIIFVSVFSVLLSSLFILMAVLRCFGVRIRRKCTNVVVEQNADGNSSGNWRGADENGDKKVDDHDDCNGVRKYSWVEIEKVTKKFSNVVASGGFSTVYLAWLPDSALGAVKLHNRSERLSQAFKEELEILLCLNHDNIVKFLGYCDDRAEEGALVFEYIPNGNLQEKLHGSRDGTIAKNQLIPWKNRMIIAYQLAQAIEYLHEKCPVPIIHGDIKASNILLDQSLNCKLCDFGFAKMGFSSTIDPPSFSSSPSTPRTKHVMMGSLGYTDPLYLKTGMASKKNDVYSYGVIILELVTGMEAFCSERGGMLTTLMAPMLKDYVQNCEARKVVEMVDPTLGGMFDLEEARAMLLIATMCISQAHAKRPSATQILQTISDQISSISFPDSEASVAYNPLYQYRSE